ncbi:hypothetical protein HYO65_gp254 [Tenacibaculum phage PTm1]|uniref:Uncharacterized protein n=2 Tax=Shirahamavirus PTm1 TaxID=2846435 RepID=A0A5S9HXD7_9CAUD|nr:hypothetical protein HYO65_gp254 [Tenacibaculum phage PTm1]BBI90646.1 hypothetical protein [Tenacibaculum phage PTm1]BBI90952.1 hypothetical protein [Tenacibaculum phage PTm5]
MNKRYTIYDYIDYTDGFFTPSDESTVPKRVNPKKDLIIRPYEEILLSESGEVNEIVHWDSPEKNVPLLHEFISYERDKVGTRTKGLALTQTKVLKWYYHDEETSSYSLDEDVNNHKTLIKDYSKGAVVDSQGNKLPTAEQTSEWKRKSQNVISYMLTNEVAGTLIDQAVFQLFDNIMVDIQKWQNNPVSTAFMDAVNEKKGGFELQLSPTVKLNIWDINVSRNPEKQYSLQYFMQERLRAIMNDVKSPV